MQIANKSVSQFSNSSRSKILHEDRVKVKRNTIPRFLVHHISCKYTYATLNKKLNTKTTAEQTRNEASFDTSTIRTALRKTYAQPNLRRASDSRLKSLRCLLFYSRVAATSRIINVNTTPPFAKETGDITAALSNAIGI